jgi:hypothetical protein
MAMALGRGDESFPSAKAFQNGLPSFEGCSMRLSIDSPRKSFPYGVGDDVSGRQQSMWQSI